MSREPSEAAPRRKSRTSAGGISGLAILGWIVLAGLCVALLLGAATMHRSGPAVALGPEAAFLGWLAGRLGPPGLAVANALGLVAAAGAAAVGLRRVLGGAAPWWAAAFVFASAAPAAVFAPGPDGVLLGLAACGLAVAMRGEAGGSAREVYRPPATGARAALGGVAAGLLLGLPILARPWTLGLLVAAALAAPKAGRRASLAGLAGGALAAWVLAAGLQVAGGGSWNPLGPAWRPLAQSGGAVARAVGEQAVDLTGGERADRRESGFTGVAGLSPALLGENARALFAGRHIGILPYYLPLVLGLFSFAPGRGRWALLLAAVLGLLALLLLSPFDLAGGAATLGNRLFLPLYPAFWWLAGRPPARPGRAVAAALAVAALATPFLLPLWTGAWTSPIADGGRLRVSLVAGRWLPFEIAQPGLPGTAAVRFGEATVRPAGGAVRRAGPGLVVTGGGWAELAIAGSRPFEKVTLGFDRSAPASLEVAGGELVDTLLRGDGRVAFAVVPRRRATLPLEAGAAPAHVAVVRFRFPVAVPAPIGVSVDLDGW